MGEVIGAIARLQIQVNPLTASGVYEPQHLVSVERASLSAAGMLGWDGRAWVVDAHHTAHPRSRGGGRRALSVGFSGHYEAMTARFGAAPVGIAGENVVVEGPPLRHPEIRGGLLLRRTDGTEIELRGPRVASPCAEFTSFLMGFDGPRPRDEIAAELSFLDAGTRGYIVDVGHLEGVEEIRVGDEILLNGAGH